MRTRTNTLSIPSILALLTLMFIGLKLSGILEWSWIWVLSPILIPPAIFVIVGIVICCSIGISELMRSQ